MKSKKKLQFIRDTYEFYFNRSKPFRDTELTEQEKEAFDSIEKDLEVLEILKKCEDEKHSLYCVCVLNALSSGKITQDDVINVKEWLDGKD